MQKDLDQDLPDQHSRHQDSVPSKAEFSFQSVNHLLSKVDTLVSVAHHHLGRFHTRVLDQVWEVVKSVGCSFLYL